jgi:hypothetical protein
MAKITDRSSLNVGTELLIDEVARTFELSETGAGNNLTATDGVTIQALYSKLVDLWATSTYQDSPFPMNALDALSGQYQIGIDAGGNSNGWAPLNDFTRQVMRDGGWEEYNDAGTLLRVYAGVVGLGSISGGSQPYYQITSTSAPVDFTFTDQVNEGIQVFGNADNGSFDNRTFFKGFVREQGKIFADSVLADTGKTDTGAFIVNLLLSNQDDLKITETDANIATNAPYTGINVEYFATSQNRLVGGTNYPYQVIIEGNGATLEEIYEKIQYLLRQNSDIDNGTGGVIGQTADALLAFVGETLVTATGVYVDNIQQADSNRIEFTDENGIVRTNPFTAAGVLNFNDIMVGAESSYRLMYTSPAGADNNYGESGAITVQDSSGSDITGVITSGSIGFDFDYDGDSFGGTAGTDKGVTLIGIRPNASKFAVATGTLTRSKALTLSLVAERDRAYI